MQDVVKIIVPAKAEHLLIVRLATSGVCSRMGMSIEAMEDAKAATAEACLLHINDPTGFDSLEVSFLAGEGLQVRVQGTGSGARQSTEDIDYDFSLALLQALTDTLELTPGTVSFRFSGGSAR
jgi:hypothetical protein